MDLQGNRTREGKKGGGSQGPEGELEVTDTTTRPPYLVTSGWITEGKEVESPFVRSSHRFLYPTLVG